MSNPLPPCGDLKRAFRYDLYVACSFFRSLNRPSKSQHSCHEFNMVMVKRPLVKITVKIRSFRVLSKPILEFLPRLVLEEIAGWTERKRFKWWRAFWVNVIIIVWETLALPRCCHVVSLEVGQLCLNPSQNSHTHAHTDHHSAAEPKFSCYVPLPRQQYHYRVRLSINILWHLIWSAE